MRTTFSVAALVGLTMGQGYSNPWGYPASNTPAVVVPAPVVVVEEEPDVRPEECAASLVTINADLATIETACDVDANQLAAIEAMLAIQAPQVDALVATFDANAAGLAGATAQNSIQDFQLGDLLARIIDLKDKLDDNADPLLPPGLAQKLDGYMTKLAEIKALVDAIAAAEVEAAAIQVLITANIAANTALGPAGTIKTLVDAAVLATTAFGVTDTAITQAATDIATNLASQTANDMAAATLKTALDMQALSSDYYTQNSSAIVFDVGNSFTDSSANAILSFPVVANQPYEFWAYLTSTSEQQDGELSSIFLTDQTIGGAGQLAASTKSTGGAAPRPDRQFPLFYKGIPAANGCLSVEYTAVNSGNHMAEAQIGALQWGLKKYAEDDVTAGTYPFTSKIFDSAQNLANCA